MKKRTWILAALALALVSAAGVGSAYAYFTTYAAAQGGYVVSLGDRTDVEEDFADWTKRVTITSEEDSEPVYIRARAYGPETYPLWYSGDGWTAGDDGWYYYDAIVNGGDQTSELLVQITDVPEEEALNLKDGDKFSVVVVYESAPVRYDEDGVPYENNSAYAGWETILDSGQMEGGGD